MRYAVMSCSLIEYRINRQVIGAVSSCKGVVAVAIDISTTIAVPAPVSSGITEAARTAAVKDPILTAVTVSGALVKHQLLKPCRHRKQPG